jgi:hypothetical protein
VAERICIFGTHTSDKLPFLPIELVKKVIDYVYSLPLDTVVITGGATGVDQLAYEQARRRKLATVVFEAEWDKYGLGAGPRRNAQMVSSADRGQGFRAPGRSPGTDNCENQFKRAGKPVEVFRL